MAIPTYPITLNRAGDLRQPFIMRATAGGPVVDISADDVLLTVEGSFELIPGAHPTNPLGREFHFTKAMANMLPARPLDYRIVRTVNGEPQVIAQGKISAEGFA